MPFGISKLNALARFEAPTSTTRTAKSITAVGNVQVSTAQSVFGGASALFDGTADYLNVTGFESVNTFTFESRIRFIALPTAGNFHMLVGTSSTQYFGLANIGGTYFWEVSVITSGQAQYVHRWTSTGIATNTWFHIAVQKTGTTVSCYQDGTSRTTNTSFNTLTSAMTLIDSSTFLGSWSNTSYTVNGYMDEIRYSNVVRYSSNFATPTSAFSNDTNTLLLIHADGTNGSTTFTDDVTLTTRPARTLTAVGNAQVSTAQSVFGGSSAFFDGAGDYITASADSSDFGTGNFTIEGRIRFATVSGVRVFYDRRETGAGIPTPNGILLYWDGSTFVYHGNGATRISGGTASINTWYHWAVSRSNGSTRMFINGTQVGSTFTDSQNYNVAETNYIGASVSLDTTWFNGWIDEVRVSNIARYTANFTPATAPFVNDSNTLLLIHADNNNASTTFIDDIGNGVGRSRMPVAVTGNAAVTTSTSKFGGASATFDGNGDSLTLPTNGSLDLTGDFTVECWFRSNLTTGTFPMIQPFFRTDTYLFYLTNTGTGTYGTTFDLYNTSTGSVALGTEFQVLTSTWYHMAGVRQGNTFKWYFNGTQVASATVSGTISTTSICRIGNYDGTWWYNGFLDEFRISNTARYTANFTPSTTAFTNDANTLLLLHMNGTNGSTTFTDDNA